MDYDSWSTSRINSWTITIFCLYCDLSDKLTANVTLFVDDTSLFSVFHNMNTSTINLDNGLNKIRNWSNFEEIFQRKVIL